MFDDLSPEDKALVEKALLKAEAEYREKAPAFHKEWFEIKKLGDQGEVLARGMQWLEKHKDDHFAGVVIAHLVDISPSKKLLQLAKSWLSQFPNDRSSVLLVSCLVKHDPSPEIAAMAAHHLDHREPIDLHFLIRALVQSSDDQDVFDDLYVQIEDLMERCPDDEFIWSGLIPFKKNSKAERLLVRWIQLNIDNPRMFLYTSLPATESPELVSLTFEWLCKGGKDYKYKPNAIQNLIEAADNCNRDLLPRITKFALDWIEENPTDEYTGAVWGSVIKTDISGEHIERAKEWYEQNKTTSKSAWFIVTTLLENGRVDADVLKEAKRLLECPKFAAEHPRLSSSLLCAQLQFHPDPEIIAAAKEKSKSSDNFTTLIDLLAYTPDEEVVSIALSTFDRWIGNQYAEHYLIYAILKADPANELARRYGCDWVERNKEHEHCKPIQELLDKHSKK